MISLIEKLQRQPESTRRLALYIILTILMVIVLFVWLETLKDEPAEEKQKSPTPLSIFAEEGSFIWERFGEIYDNARDTFTR